MSFAEAYPYIKLAYIIIKLMMTIAVTVLEATVAKKCMERSKSLTHAMIYPFDVKMFEHACVLHMVGCYMWLLVFSQWLFTSYYGVTRWQSQIHSVVMLWYFNDELQKNQGFEEKYKGDIIFDVFERDVFLNETFTAIDEGAHTFKEIAGIMDFLRLYFTVWVCVRFVWFVSQYVHRFLFANL